MSELSGQDELQRNPGAPPLPAHPIRFVLHFVDRRRQWFAAIAFLEAASSACGIAIPMTLGRISGAVTRAASASPVSMDGLRAPILVFLGLGLGEVLFGATSRGIQLRIGPRQRQEVLRESYAYLQHHSHSYLQDNFAGALVHRLSEMSQGVNMALWTILFDFWPLGITFSVSVALLVAASPRLGALVGAWAVAFIGCSFWLARRSRPFAVKAASARSDTVGRIADSVTNLASVKLFARLQFEQAFLDTYLAKELRAVWKSLTYTERIRRFQFAAAALLKVAVVWYALRLWGEGRIGVAEFVTSTSMSLLLITESRNLSRRFLEFFEYIGNVANGVHTLIRPHDLVDRAGARSIEVPRGEIAFRDVDFAYPSARQVFSGLNVTIRAGERVGLVGQSGSGKTTFTSLILRLHDPQRGQILVDGVDIRSVTQESLHERLSLIPQDPTLFHRTLRENIRYGRLDASDAEVVAAARRARADEFIERMPERYDAMVGERGVKLSGGQRQRIAIARVILKDAPILILDEATSSMDSITEHAIQESLSEVMRGKTVLVVTHRLSTVAHLDRILVFEDGRIVEDGSPAELFDRGGVFHRLWSRQADGFLPDARGPSSPSPAPEPWTEVRRPPLADDEAGKPEGEGSGPLVEPGACLATS